MSAAISLRNIKHRFKPRTSNAAICGECDGAFDDPRHSATPMLDYPLDWSGHLLGPTLIYIDNEGTPIQLRLTNDLVQGVIDIWNTNEVLAHATEIEYGDNFTGNELKPPRAESHVQVGN
jgi:hypothetical protein